VDTNAYLTFLLLGAVLVAIDGQIIYRSGRRLLRQSGADAGGAESMTKLIAVLFHLVALGVLALGSTVDPDSWDSVTGVVARLGFLLLFLAIAHWVATTVLANFRDRELSRKRRLAHRDVGGQNVGESPVAPVGGQPPGETWVSPSLEDREPYTAP